MPRLEDIQHSVLIVTAVESFGDAARRALPRGKVMALDVQKSATAARQLLLERYYDIVIVNLPLPDETGEELAYDMAEMSDVGVLVVAPSDRYEDVRERAADFGVMVVQKPLKMGQLRQALRFLLASADKLQRLRRDILRAQEKLEELRIVDRAKFVLVEEQGMTEDEAHRFIGKQAMDNGLSRRRIAERILEEE